MKKITSLLLCLTLVSACSEIELGSHIAKNIVMPSDIEPKIGYFKVGNPYKIKGRTYYPKEKYQYSETGVASWYGPGFHGKMTANGEIFNQHELTAAHRTLQMPSMVRVTNLENGRSIIVRVNDRGPFAHNRVIDLSEKAAELIGMKHKGTARVRVDVLEKESRQVAQAARNGVSTRGTEVVLNRGQNLDEKMPLVIAKPQTKPAINETRLASVQQRNINDDFKSFIVSKAQAAEIPRKPRTPSLGHKYYVDAGNFETADAALTMKMSLEQMGHTTSLQRAGEMHHLNVGPFDTEQSAKEFLTTMQSRNRNASLVIVQK